MEKFNDYINSKTGTKPKSAHLRKAIDSIVREFEDDSLE